MRLDEGRAVAIGAVDVDRDVVRAGRELLAVNGAESARVTVTGMAEYQAETLKRDVGVSHTGSGSSTFGRSKAMVGYESKAAERESAVSVSSEEVLRRG